MGGAREGDSAALPPPPGCTSRPRVDAGCCPDPEPSTGNGRGRRRATPRPQGIPNHTPPNSPKGPPAKSQLGGGGLPRIITEELPPPPPAACSGKEGVHHAREEFLLPILTFYSRQQPTSMCVDVSLGKCLLYGVPTTRRTAGWADGTRKAV